MKKQFVMTAVAALFSVGMGVAHAVDGTINFVGTVTADSCTVDINDQTNPTLNPGTVNTVDLAKAGDTGRQRTLRWISPLARIRLPQQA